MAFEEEVRELQDLYEERTRVQLNILYKREILKQNEVILATVDRKIKKILTGRNGKTIQYAYEKTMELNKARIK